MIVRAENASGTKRCFLAVINLVRPRLVGEIQPLLDLPDTVLYFCESFTIHALRAFELSHSVVIEFCVTVKMRSAAGFPKPPSVPQAKP